MKNFYIYHSKKDWFNFKGAKLLSTSEAKDFLELNSFDLSIPFLEDSHHERQHKENRESTESSSTCFEAS